MPKLCNGKPHPYLTEDPICGKMDKYFDVLRTIAQQRNVLSASAAYDNARAQLVLWVIPTSFN